MRIHLHRFGDKVAVSLIPHDGETVYLTPDEADALSAALADYSSNVRACKFTDSGIGNAEVNVPNPEKHH